MNLCLAAKGCIQSLLNAVIIQHPLGLVNPIFIKSLYHKKMLYSKLFEKNNKDEASQKTK